jgi:hypothetical protein
LIMPRFLYDDVSCFAGVTLQCPFFVFVVWWYQFCSLSPPIVEMLHANCHFLLVDVRRFWPIWVSFGASFEQHLNTLVDCGELVFVWSHS